MPEPLRAPRLQGDQFALHATLGSHVVSSKFKAKGFGIMAHGVGYYGPTSVIVVLKYLAHRRRADTASLTLCQGLANACGHFVMAGPVSIANQHGMARALVRSAIDSVESGA